jgi:hypothetical protein
VTLSSSKAQYVAISESVEEIEFINFILLDIGIDIELSIVLKTDNIGAMFLTQNTSTGEHRRHVDTRHYFIREIVKEDKMISLICQIM